MRRRQKGHQAAHHDRDALAWLLLSFAPWRYRGQNVRAAWSRAGIFTRIDGNGPQAIDNKRQRAQKSSASLLRCKQLSTVVNDTPRTCAPPWRSGPLESGQKAKKRPSRKQHRSARSTDNHGRTARQKPKTQRHGAQFLKTTNLRRCYAARKHFQKLKHGAQFLKPRLPQFLKASRKSTYDNSGSH